MSVQAASGVRANGCWLLIVAGFASSSFFDPSESTRVHEYRSDFARTFFSEYFSGRWFELKTRTVNS